MFKLDKNTHMMILFTFALVFIVIYLYYTITDVRKMQRDIARLTSEVSALTNKGPSNVPVSVSAPSPAPTSGQVPRASAPPPTPVVQIKECKPVAESKTVVPVEEDAMSDSSVTTEDIKATLDSVDAELELEQELELDTDTVVEAKGDIDAILEEDEAVIVEPFNDLHKMKFDDIKELCRSKGIKIQGSKDVLIKRLIEHGL